MTISQRAWLGFVNKLSAINKTASNAMVAYVNTHGLADVEGLIDYAYGLATKYGEASAALSAEMYDAVAALSKKAVPPAVPAQTATRNASAKVVQGAMKTSQNPEVIGGAVSRLVKQVGQDTLLQNALRDGAEFAWIPNGDTCAFCIMLASNGWQKASKDAVNNGHAEHIHQNCDCTYLVRFSSDVDVYGYNDGARYRQMYENADGYGWEDKVNSMRREFYAKNREEIRAQQNSAYEKRIELNSSKAEEADV